MTHVAHKAGAQAVGTARSLSPPRGNAKNTSEIVSPAAAADIGMIAS